MDDLEHFKRNGFSSLGNLITDESDRAFLKRLAEKLFEDPRNQELDSVSQLGCLEHVYRFDSRVGQIVNRLLENEHLKRTMGTLLGEDYKVWSIGFRRSNPGDQGLYLHQDGVGQINMFVCLDDNPEGIGSSLFLKGSHKVNQTLRAKRAEAPPRLLRFIFFLFSRMAGRVGEVFIFTNKIWHGRFWNHGSIEHDVLTIGFFNQQFCYGGGLDDALKHEFRELELGKRAATSRDINGRIFSSVDYREEGSFSHVNHGVFALDIEERKYLEAERTGVKLFLSAALVMSAMSAWNFFRDLRRCFKG